MRVDISKPIKLNNVRPELAQEDWTLVHRFAKRIDSKAKVGTPYSAMALFDAMQVMHDNETLPMSFNSGLIYALMRKHNWVAVGLQGIFMKSPGETSLVEVMVHSLPRGIPYPVTQIVYHILKLVGEDISRDSMRKTMARLVRQNKFRRVEDGVYEKIQRGL